ncbi:MAG: glycosyltransferase [Bdellovibrionaceae bacterium]|nr:glycosyltransferase [Bdellovibrio sp.]
MNGISIIIPTCGEIKPLVRLIQSITKQTLDKPFEVVIVFNSISQTKFLLKKPQINFGTSAELQFIWIDAKGVNKARNAGIEKAKYNLLLFLDDDCELVNSNALQAHLNYHVAKPDLFCLGGIYNLPPRASFFDRVYNLIQIRWLYGSLKAAHSQAANFLIGGHFSAKKEILKKFEIYFNPAIIYGGSELEFFLAAQKNSLSCELSDLVVTHYTHENIWSLTRKLNRQGRGQAVAEQNFPVETAQLQAQLGETFTASLIMKAALIYFNYVFWYGYFSQNQRRSQFIVLLARNLLDSVRYRHFKLIQKLEAEIRIKNDQGDRL